MAITAEAIVDRIQRKLASGWKDTPVDTFLAGKPDAEVKGVVTTFVPSIEVLRKAVASGKNMIISRESPYWARDAAQLRPGTGGTGPGGAGGEAGRGPRQEAMNSDPVYRAKRDFIATNNLVVYRFFDNWDARPQDPQLEGLARALGWDKYYKPSGGQPWTSGDGYFAIPQATSKRRRRPSKRR